VAHHQRPAAFGQPLYHVPKRRGEQQRLLLDQAWVDDPHAIQVGTFARSLRRLPPAILYQRPQSGSHGDRYLVLADRMAQDLQHLGGACRASGNERRIRRVQPVPADQLGVCHSLRCQAIPVVVSMPAQLNIPHERVLPRYRVAMPNYAEINQQGHALRAWK